MKIFSIPYALSLLLTSREILAVDGDSGCVTMIAYENFGNCTGASAINQQFATTLDDPSDTCFEFNNLGYTGSVTGQYCDSATGHFFQKMYNTTDCSGEPMMTEFSADACLSGIQLQEPCNTDSSCKSTDGDAGAGTSESSVGGTVAGGGLLFSMSALTTLVFLLVAQSC